MSSFLCPAFIPQLYFSLAKFSRHGGLTEPYKDGWGIGFYHGKDL